MSSAISNMVKTKAKTIVKFLHPIIIICSILIIIIVGPYLFYTISFMGKVFPNIYVSGVNIGGLSQSAAVDLLTTQNQNVYTANVISKTNSHTLKADDVSLTYDYAESVNRAYNLVRTGNFFIDTYNRLSLIRRPKNLGLSIIYDAAKVDSFISSISNEVTSSPEYPSVAIIDGRIDIKPGKVGTVLDTNQFKLLLGNRFAFKINESVYLPTMIINPTLSDLEVTTAKTRAEKYIGKSMTLKFEDTSNQLTDNDLIKFIDLKNDYDVAEIVNQITKVGSTINRDPQNAKFEFDGNRVIEFSPALDGITINSEELKNLMVTNLDSLANNEDKTVVVTIPVTKVKPRVTTDQVNNLGIKELIGSATSTYFHSIPGRVFNVNLAASRVNGTLVAPGQTFSFNQTLGDVSKFTGYKEAYVISGGKTVLGDGGGVCQVSTTLFRSVLNAGLPVDQRSAHAYRVGYYEQNSPPGLDATVYSPNPDFKFTNDTGNYILIQAKNDSINYSLVFNLYGTSDGRTSTLSKPVISNYSAPLPTVYQDDPTLPVGTLKQTDYAAAGARVTFSYAVNRNGEQIYQKTFISNYRPWAAMYLRGTKI